MTPRIGMVVALLVAGCSAQIETDPGAGGAAAGGAGGSGGGGGAGGELSAPTSAACPEFIGELDDEAAWLGFIAPLSGQFEIIGEALALGVELQHEELFDTTGRRVNVLLCDSQPDAEPAMDHLVDTVGVPAIIGPAFSSTLLDVADRAIASGTLLISPSSTSPAVTDLDDNSLVWRTAPADDELHVALAALTSELEARVRTEQSIPNGTSIRVAVLASDNLLGERTFDAYVETVVINGMTVAANAGDVLTVSVPLPQDNPDYSSIVAQVATFEPHLVIGMGFFGEIVDPIAMEIEAALAASAPAPYYALTETSFDAALAASSDAALAPRLTGVRGAWGGLLWDAFVVRHTAAFGFEPNFEYAANAYDAAMLLSFALAGTEIPSGSSLAVQLGEMTTGPIIRGEPTHIAEGIALRSNGATFDYEGASGPVDFDLATGNVLGWIDAWCFSAPGVDTSVPYYDPKAGAVTGELGCP